MKKEDLMKKHFPMNLHLFGHDAGEGGDGNGAGGDDQDGNDKPDEDGEDGADSGESEEKKYSDKDMEAAVQKRIARERRKWQREQQRNNPSTGGGEKDGKDKKDQDGGDESEADKKAREAEAKAEALEMKWTCLEHDVKKDCVDDVLALAKMHMEKDSATDIEDAIDKVLKKYPQFKDGYEDPGDEGQEKKGWGQRHGKPSGKSATVDDEIRKQLFGK